MRRKRSRDQFQNGHAVRVRGAKVTGCQLKRAATETDDDSGMGDCAPPVSRLIPHSPPLLLVIVLVREVIRLATGSPTGFRSLRECRYSVQSFRRSSGPRKLENTQ